MSSVITDIYSDAVDSVITNSFTNISSDPPFVSMAESEAIILLVCLGPRLKIQILFHPLVVLLQVIIKGVSYSLYQMSQPSCTGIKFILLVFPLPKQVIQKLCMLIFLRKYGISITARKLRL